MPRDRSDTSVHLLVFVSSLSVIKLRSWLFSGALHSVFLRIYSLQHLDDLLDLSALLRVAVLARCRGHRHRLLLVALRDAEDVLMALNDLGALRVELA